MNSLAEEYMASDEQLFVIFSSCKSDSCRVVKSYIPGQLVSCHPLLDFLETGKCYFSRVMRPSDQGYPSFIELLFSILAA
jgi:hypothetical protein